MLILFIDTVIRTILPNTPKIPESLTLILIGGKKKEEIRVRNFHVASLCSLLFKSCACLPLSVSLFEISAMFLDGEIDTIIVPLAKGNLLCRLLRALIWGRLTP